MPGQLTRIAAALLLFAAPARAAEFDGLFYGSNDFGAVGLMQTPTARMRADGEFGVSVSTVRPYNQLDLFLQPLPWLETTVRYTDITNRFYSNNPAFSGKQHDKDKSADFKIRLLREGQWWPQVAVGVQDIGGTGLFSSEYLVTNYHWYDFDVSAGLAWGRLGSGGDIYNPFRVFGKHFENDRNRASSGGQGGTPGVKSWFTGKTIGPFGGVAWNTPLKGLQLRVEYDGNDYQHEALSNKLRQSSPINVGLAYRGISGIDLGVGLERGNTVMGRVTLYTNFQKFIGVAKTADPPLPVLQAAAAAAPAPQEATTDAAAPPPVPVGSAASGGGLPLLSGSVGGAVAAPSQLPLDPEEQPFVFELRKTLRQQGFTLIAVDYDRNVKQVRVWLKQDRYRNPAKAASRAARILCGTAPAAMTQFLIINVDQGMETYRVLVQRAGFEKAMRGETDLDGGLDAIRLQRPGHGYGAAEYFDDTRFPAFSWDMGPAVRQSIGGPNDFYIGQLYWKVNTSLALTDHLSLSGAAGFNIINNFDKITLESNSKLPHVRSDVVKYLQQGKDGLINLEADYTWSPAPQWYHRMSVGIFEEMYGGVATELLYRPFGQSWALALDVNRVKKRGFDEQFDFQSYTVTTGHATLYYKPGYYNLLFKLSGGQYLARDRGATLDISREFDNGVRAGLFATKTNVSAAQFGEGSFDKGLYLSLPLDLFFTRSTRREAGITFRPLTRDGGQMVYDGPELYFTTQHSQPSDFERGVGELLK